VPSILIVDDDAQFRRTLHIALNSHGYEVINAADGKEALDLAASRVPDLIVLDWQLPGMSGIETCRALRARSGVPIVMVSGNRSNSKEVALAAGANGYLAKPFSINDLLTRIETALKSSPRLDCAN
jgi:two-component system, OmpR family, KDP operon response regulator KdpE